MQIKKYLIRKKREKRHKTNEKKVNSGEMKVRVKNQRADKKKV